MPDLKLEHSLVDGRYEVYERLTRGSYAEIFVAYDRAVNRAPVVIKALNTSLQGTPDPDLERTLVENFQNEAVALDAVRHPHVILRLGHGTASDLREVPFHYLVIEYMPGGDLLELCRHRPDKALPLDEALFYFHQVCEALAFAHSHGIIHRDLKPNNFLLSADKRTLKVADFGVAKITSGESTEITRVGADVYAPPEHNPNEDTGDLQKLTTAADVYSLAKSFYTVICGRAPNQFRCDPITSLPDTLANKPWGSALLKVLQKATDDDPKARYATVAEFWHELAQVAALNPTVKIEEIPDEETIVKPRQKFDTGAFPTKPVQPDFDPTPATSQLQEVVSSALPVEHNAKTITTPEAKTTEPAKIESEATLPKLEATSNRPAPAERPGKIFIELQPQKATPIPPMPSPATTPANQAPIIAKAGQAKSPAKAAAKQQPKMASRFPEKIRRRVFIAFMGAAFIGLLVSIFNIFKGGQVGSPSEIEVMAVALNVRSGPGDKFKVFGTVSQTTRHRVIQENEQGWMLIEVSRWMELEPDAPLDVRQGWVYGKSDYVRVVSRRWW